MSCQVTSHSCVQVHVSLMDFGTMFEPNHGIGAIFQEKLDFCESIAIRQSLMIAGPNSAKKGCFAAVSGFGV